MLILFNNFLEFMQKFRKFSKTKSLAKEAFQGEVENK